MERITMRRTFTGSVKVKLRLLARHPPFIFTATGGDMPAINSRPMTGSPSELFDYYSSDGASDGRWLGLGLSYLTSPAATLSTKEQFLLVAEGLDLDGTKKIQTNNGKHVPLIDLTISAPKWVSSMMVTATPAERALIQEAWDQHVTEQFARMEARAEVARVPVAKPSACTRTNRMRGSKTRRVPAKLIAYVVNHHTARPTPETDERGAPPDPHLHTHILLMNMAWVETEKGGKWKAIDDAGIKAQAEQMLWESEGDFARRLEDLGYHPRFIKNRQGNRRTWMDSLTHIADFWSSNARRRDQIIADFITERDRPPTDAELRDRLRWTRKDKTRTAEADVDWDGLFADAVTNGHLPPRVEPSPDFCRMPLAYRLDNLRKRLIAPNGLCHRDATFGYRDLQASVARCAVGLGLTYDEIDAFTTELIADLSPVVTHDDITQCSWTTTENLEDEWTIDRILRAKAQETFEAPTPDAIDRAIAELAAEGIVLDDEQIAMVKAACGNSGISFHEGFAGTGKTTSLKAVVRALRDSTSTGKAIADKIIVVSTARDTAQRTGRKLDADAWHSIESFCLGVSRGTISPNKRMVIILDEAAMVDNPRMAKLLQAMKSARLVCIGDPEQLQPIGAGGWYQDAVRWAKATMLRNVHRQKHSADIEAFADLRKGRADRALASLRDRGRVHESRTHAERIGNVIADYKAARDAGRSVNDLRIILDGKNIEIDKINKIIQQDRLRRGELTGDPLTMASESSERTWDIYVGDEVSFIQGHYIKATKTNITNGTKARVVDIDHETRHVKLFLIEDQIEVSIPVPELKKLQDFSPCYAMHAQRLQGGEAPITYVLLGSRPSRQGGYSTFTRCIEELHVYIDRQTHGKEPYRCLTEQLKKSRAKISARRRKSWHHGLDDDDDPIPTHTEPDWQFYRPPQHSAPRPHRHSQQRRRRDTGFGIGLV